MPRSTALRVALDTNTVVSGTTFRGPESVLLHAGLRRDYAIVLPWLVVEQTFLVLQRKMSGFQDAPAMARAVVANARVIPEDLGRHHVEAAASFIKEASDAAILAALLGEPPDYFVTGDKGFLVLNGRLPFPVLRTRAMLALLEEG